MPPQPKPDAGGKQPPWLEGECVSTPPTAFATAGTQAVEFHLANRTAENFADFKRLYNLGDDPTLVEPGWADLLVDYLRGPSISALLLVIGGLALYTELHAPGWGWAVSSAPSASCCSSGAITCRARPSGWKSPCSWPGLPAC